MGRGGQEHVAADQPRLPDESRESACRAGRGEGAICIRSAKAKILRSFQCTGTIVVFAPGVRNGERCEVLRTFCRQQANICPLLLPFSPVLPSGARYIELTCFVVVTLTLQYAGNLQTCPVTGPKLHDELFPDGGGKTKIGVRMLCPSCRTNKHTKPERGWHSKVGVYLCPLCT